MTKRRFKAHVSFKRENGTVVGAGAGGGFGGGVRN